MYKLLLILKYLRKRRIAWIALIAVTLCTALVLVVISVMGGWVRMFEDNFRKVTSDIVLSYHGSLKGFPYYERMITGIEKLPEVEAAVPVIQSFGLLNIDNQRSEGVQVVGYPIEKIGRVNDFPESLYWQYQRYIEESNKPGLSWAQREALRQKAEQSAAHPSFSFSPLPSQERERLAEERKNWPGMIVSNNVIGIRKDQAGRMEGRDVWKYSLSVVLVVFDVQKQDFHDTSSITRRPYWIADDSHTGAWQFDADTVYVPFAVVQRDMGMDAQEMENAKGQKITKPARTHEVRVRVKPGYDLATVREKIETVVESVMDQVRTENDEIGAPRDWAQIQPEVETWRQNKAAFLSAVEHEKVLVVFLLSLISIVAIFLIFCIFYMIVMEKTPDIGIIKSVGATSGGVAAIFLGYGAAIGCMGGGLGFLVGYVIVHNINYIHAQLAHWMAIEIWRPDVYLFDTIPNMIDPRDAIVIVAVAVLSSILGALVPAVRAARMTPVEAVRYE